MNHTNSLQHRKIFLLENNYATNIELLNALLSILNIKSALFFSNQSQDEFNNLFNSAKTPSRFLHLRSNTSKTYLGTNQECVVFDMFFGLDVNALLLLSGCIQAGGSLILLAPPNWQNAPDLDYQKIACFPYSYKQLTSYFLKFLHQNLTQTDSVHICNMADIAKIATIQKQQDTIATFELDYRQKQVSSAILDLFTGKLHSLLVSGVRGSGKTITSAWSLAEYLPKSHAKNVVIIADNKNIARNFFAKLTNFLHLPQTTKLNYGDNCVSFFAPDALLPQNIDILIIEEAGNFNAKQLQTWLHTNARVLFISTQDGYEGSNNAIKINLSEKIEKTLNLQNSFRFAANDNINLWLNACFFIDNTQKYGEVKLKTPSRILQLDTAKLEFKAILPNYLLANIEDFKQIYNLLAMAHYRTRPSDIRQILDAPNAKLYAVILNNKIIAVAFCLAEGNLPDNLLEAIASGKRRVKGHLIPQSLALHLNAPKLAKLQYLRISRIAVAQEYRRHKIATQLLDFIAITNAASYDALATSFAAKSENINFWRANKFELIKAGKKIEKTTGLNSYQMVKPLNQQAEQIFANLKL